MARMLPNNLEAEMSVLGVCFINGRDVDKVVEDLHVDMFFDERNKILFNAIKTLHDEKIPIDVTTLKNELDKTKKLNSIGLDYIMEVIDSVVSSSNLDYYMNIVKENATRRILIQTSENISKNAFDEEDLNVLLDSYEQEILNVVRHRSSGEFLSISEVLKRAQEKLELLSKTKSPVTGLETGFYEFDKISTGFQPGEMIILAARPGMGKTALALNMATYAASTTKKAVAIFNLEMPAEMLVNRMISSVGQIDAYKLQTGLMAENDWKRYNEAMSQLSDTNIYIEDDAGITCSEIRAKCRRLASTDSGLGLVVIDYLQLVSTGNRRVESRQVEVSEISRSLKTMALELGVPVIALSQLSRSAEKRENNQPMLADLRESGSLEQDADMVLFINRKDYYEKKDISSKIVPAELVIAKHRKGGLGTIDLQFDLSKSCFKNILKSQKEDE